MQALLNTSRDLLERVYNACKGISPAQQQISYMFLSTYHEVEARLLKAWPESPCSIHFEKVDRLGSEVLHREAYNMLREMEPLYRLIQDMSELKSRLTAYLRQHGQLASAFSVQRTPGLLGDFIELTGNAVRMHLLARHMPYKHIIQLYALVYNTVEMQECQRGATPPDMRAMINYVQAFPHIIHLLQSEFQPVSSCIGQVLETSACRAVLEFGGSSAMRASGLLDLGSPASRMAAAAEALTTENGWALIEWLPRLRDWALLACLICPGEAIRPGALQSLEILLQETLLMPVYREHCEWVHPLFEAHVRPTLVTFYNNVKPGLELTDRKALSKSAKRLVEESLKEALSGCGEEHRKRRVLLTDALQRMVTQAVRQHSDVAHRSEAMLAVLSCARAEVIWFFQHWGEVVPKGLFQSLLSSSEPLKELSAGHGLVGLVAAMAAAETFLRSHEGAIAWQVAVELQELLDNCPLDLNLSKSSSFTAELQVILAALQALHNAPCARRENGEAAVRNSWTPYPVEPDLEAARVFCERLYCETIFLEASTSGAAAAWPMEAARGDRPLGTLCTLLQRTRLSDGLHSCISTAASLHQLAFCYQRGDPRQLKLREAMLASLELPFKDIRRGVPAWLYVLSWLADATDQDTSASCAAAASALAEELMYAVAETFRQLVTDAHKFAPDLRGAGSQAPGSALSAVKTPRQGKGQGLLRDIRNILDSMEDVHASSPSRQQQESLEEYNKLMTAARQLSASLARSEAVQIHAELTITPAAHLMAAARATFQCLLSSFAFPKKELARPMQLERAVQKLLRIYQALQEASGCGLMGVVRDVLAREAYSPLPQQPPDPASGERLVAFVGEWYVQTVVRDSANIGITFSLSRGMFYSSRGSALAEYACERELRALVRTFGLYGARELGARTEQPLAEAVSGLHAILASHEELLSNLHTDSEVHGSCLEACQSVAAGFADLQAVTERCRLLARTLFLRRLIAAAAAAEAAALLPGAAACLEAASLAAAGCRGPHVCDLLDLPRPPSSMAAPDAAADPVLARLMAGDGSRRWRHWPLLLALTLWSPVWASATYSPRFAAPLNNMDYLAVVVPDMALSAAAVAAQEGEVGHLADERTAAAGEMVRGFMRCASASLVAREECLESKATALRRVAEVAHDCGLLDADEALRACHLAPGSCS